MVSRPRKAWLFDVYSGFLHTHISIRAIADAGLSQNYDGKAADFNTYRMDTVIFAAAAIERDIPAVSAIVVL